LASPEKGKKKVRWDGNLDAALGDVQEAHAMNVETVGETSKHSEI